MSMRVFCGPFQPALEDAFVERVRELSAERRSFAVVAPSRRMAERLQRLLALERGMALLGARFHTFHSLAAEVVDEEGGPAKDAILDGLFHDRIIDEILASEFRDRASTRGWGGAYRASLRDLTDCGFSSAAYLEHFSGLFQEGSERRRLEEVLQVQERYLRRLDEAGILPPSGLARAAAEIARSRAVRVLENYGELLYYGFYDLTGAQTDFFSAVASARPVRVFFPYVKDHPGYRFARRFYEEVLHSGEAPVQLAASDASRGLGPVLDALSCPDRRAVTPREESLAVISASGGADEVWAAAKDILRLRAGARALDFSDIGIVARTLEPYRFALASVLRENAIPFTWGLGDPLLRHPIAKLCLCLLQLGRRDFPVSEVLDILESCYFRADSVRSGAGRRGLPLNWRGLAEKVGLRGGWVQWEGLVRMLPGEDAERLWDLLQRWKEALCRRGELSWRESSARARTLLQDHFEVEEGTPGFEAWSGVLAALNSLEVFDRGLPQVSWEGFLDAFEEKLRRAALPPPPECRGVRVLDAMDARGESFRVLFLLGLQEGSFPRQIREDPLLPDGVRQALRDAAGYRLQPKLGGYDEERLLFHLLATSASERLYCVYQRSDEDGKALVPSLYLRDLCAAAGRDLESCVQRRVPRQPLVKLEELAREDISLLAPKEASLLLARQGAPEGGLFAPLREFVPSFAFPGLYQGGLEVVRELNRTGEPGDCDGLLRPPVEFLSALDARGLSPSAVAEFRGCPFKVFASRLLGLREEDAPSSSGELNPRQKGLLYHSILERFYKMLDADGFWNGPDEADWRGRLEDCLRETLPRDGWRGFGVHPVLWMSLTERMRVHLERTIALDIARIRSDGLQPRDFERALTATVDGIMLTGKLDRIDRDRAGTRYRIVDYKTSFHKGSLKGLAEKLIEVQAPLYLGLAESVAGGARPVGADFLAIEDSVETTGHDGLRTLTEMEWREVRSRVLDGVRSLRGMMAQGRFFITPEEGQGKVCDYCSFGSLCRKSHGMTRARAEDSSLRAEFEVLRERR